MANKRIRTEEYKKKMSIAKTKYFIERELLESLYWGNEYDLTELGEIFDCDRKTIHLKMIKMSIPRRDTALRGEENPNYGKHLSEERK